jgi:enoyl-CoA hydratase/carnithine racemase
VTEDVRFEVEGGIAWLTLDRPETRNALSSEGMIESVVAAVAAAEESGAPVLVITGQGPAFSAGGDVRQMAGREGMFAGHPYELGEGYRTTIQQLFRSLVHTDLVTVASVNGAAIGAGFDIVLACDLRLGSPSARFAHTFVDLGILPGDGGAWLLPRVVGAQRAAELAFTARVIDAHTAQEYGILLSVEDDLDTATRELARSIASRPAHSLRMTKRLLRHARTTEFDVFLDMTAAMQAVAHTTDAHRQAVDGYVRRLDNR